MPLYRRIGFWALNEDVKGYNTSKTAFYGLKHEDLWLDR